MYTTIKSGASDKSYFGGKGQDGVYQTIINEIPQCQDYWEIFAGNASIYRKLTQKPERCFLIEKNQKQANRLAQNLELNKVYSLTDLQLYILPTEEQGTWVVWASAFEIFECIRKEAIDREDTFIFCDPPYMLSTRTSKNRYRHELTDKQHENLLNALCFQFEQAKIAITTYPNDLYENRLNWRRIAYNAVTNGGHVRTEHMYMNYEPPHKLQDTHYIGKDYRERETLKKQQKNWAKNFAQMHKHQRQAIIEKLIKLL